MPNELDGREFVKHGTTRTRDLLVREELDRILASPGFQGVGRRPRLLRFLVEQELAGHGDSLKELVIATEFFEKSADYDPQVDSLVRVEIGRLRSRLQEYYTQAGADGLIRIEIPKGAYRPEFIFRAGLPVDAGPEAVVEPAPAPAPAPVPAPVPARNWKWLAAAAAGVLAVGGAVWLLRTAAIPVAKSVAVLPFLNLSGDSANEYLGDGISEEVTESLAQADDLRVVARTSAFQYKGKSADVREIGRKLGARAVLEGSVGRRGGEFHVVAQLIRSSDGYHLWSDTYDAGLGELPSVEARIGEAVRTKLSATPPAARAPSPTTDPQAHDLYLRSAFEFNRRTVEATRQALALAQQAAQRDPAYPQPYVLMASCELQLSQLFAQSPHAASANARQDIAKALELDPGNSGAHAQLAMLAYTDDWDWPKAEREFQAALAKGSHGSAENLYGWCLMTRGRFAEARKHLETAAELDPLSLGPQLNQVEEMLAEQNYQEARRKVDQILADSPTNFVALSLGASVAINQKDCAALTAWSGKLLATYPQSPSAHLTSLGTEAYCGHPERVDAHLADVESGHPPGYVSPYTLALIYAVRDDPDRVMAYLQKSADLREATLLMIKVERAFDRVRQDPRFVALERQLGLTK